jgi:hypothetical protein
MLMVQTNDCDATNPDRIVDRSRLSGLTEGSHLSGKDGKGIGKLKKRLPGLNPPSPRGWLSFGRS